MVIPWGVFLKVVLSCCIVGVFLSFVYVGLRKFGVTRGEFRKWVGFGFILAAVNQFVYAEAERIGVDWLFGRCF
ncbi:hypothetical protein [Bartonella sp. B39]